MTREQAINYLISSGFTQEQVCEVVRALTYEPTTKNNLGVEEVTALAEWIEKLTKASEEAYNKGYADGMKAQEPRKGHWIKGYTFPDGEYWKCDKCNELIKVKYPMHYCNNCGSDNSEVEE